ncbi:MAG: VIT1/CCC1 transporter family protein [Paracoccaceae bacterium]|jgi:VIT1/CCC1 family predicted Fe2+/Mn2+ transporter|nr:VIT1/CCC1 transporter family protein [Paracoccaceae bacterium]MDP7184426.1 VIT1/CCC1 transporter family protein [Paracoccaceae bacterium]
MDIKQHRRDAHGINGFQENLRQIVYGGNDGIVTTFAVVAGFAGANAEGTAGIGLIAVIIFGFANLLADATSMGLGEFLSSRSEQDVYNARQRSEQHLIATEPARERSEVLSILAQKGLETNDAEKFADELCKHPDLLTDFMMRYEFGMSHPDDQNPALSGLYTFFSFLVFGCIPLLPYVLQMPLDQAFWASVAATAGALLLLGLFRWRITREGLSRSVFETLLVGGVCALVAYSVGWILGG